MLLKAGRSIRLQRRSAADIDAQCAGFKQAKSYTAAQASFDQWVRARGVQISDAAQAQACHGEFNAVGPLAVKEVGDEHSKIVDEIDLLLERHDNSYLGMERLDMEPTVMRFASEAKYSEAYQKSHPNSITNPNYDLSPASKLKYCKHLLIMWSHHQWENDGDDDSVFVSLDVHEYLPRLHTYIEKEVATRCDHGDQGPKCDQTPMTDILDTCLRRLSNNSALMKRAKKQAEESKRKLEEACRERDLLRDQKKRFKLWQQSCEAHARAYLAAIGSDSIPPLPPLPPSPPPLPPADPEGHPIV